MFNAFIESCDQQPESPAVSHFDRRMIESSTGTNSPAVVACRAAPNSSTRRSEERVVQLSSEVALAERRYAERTERAAQQRQSAAAGRLRPKATVTLDGQ